MTHPFRVTEIAIREIAVHMLHRENIAFYVVIDASWYADATGAYANLS